MEEVSATDAIHREMLQREGGISSNACALELKRRHFPLDHNWIIEAGSILDVDYVRSLGQFDIVYAWGSLHHTGEMWRAIENATLPVAQKGVLWIAIYNDQGRISRYWKRMKQLYYSGRAGQFVDRHSVLCPHGITVPQTDL